MLDDAPPPPAHSKLRAAWVAAMPSLFVFLWSTGFIGGKFGLPYAEPFTFLSLRFSFACALLICVAWAMRAPWPRDPKLIAHIAVAGLLVHATYVGGVFAAMHAGLPAGPASLIVGTQPLLTALVAGRLLGERVGALQWAGLLLGFGGVVLVMTGKGGGVESGALLRIGPAVLALFGITAGTLYQKRFCGPMDIRTGTAIQYAVSALVMIGFAFAVETRVVVWSGQFIFALAWLVIVLSFGAISLLFILIRRGVASKVASLFYLTPPVTALMSYFAFGEELGPIQLCGIGATAIGVFLVNRG